VSGTFFACLCKALPSRPVEKPRKPVLSFSNAFVLILLIDYPAVLLNNPFFRQIRNTRYPIRNTRYPPIAHLKAQSRPAGTPTSLKKRFQTASRSGRLMAACTQSPVCGEARFTSKLPTECTKMSETLRLKPV